jgi:hypothetical protein
MSNDRHTPEVARKMASAAPREPERRDATLAERDVSHADVRVREDIDDPHLDDRGDLARDPRIEERDHIDAGEMAARRGDTDDRPMAMFAGGEAAGYRTQWDAIQTGFVDEPRKAVQEADALVSLVIRRLSETFGDERASLERQWGKGDEISTEDLRLALRRYRSFFERLLSL